MLECKWKLFLHFNLNFIYFLSTLTLRFTIDKTASTTRTRYVFVQYGMHMGWADLIILDTRTLKGIVRLETY